ncbi:Vacuolar membrane protein pep3 [Fusarium oxysporum f. sp. albedinis]|nr:Vacuolar membrane protein pep3 [Fusarium oxysporum f. sp. albedinis]
MLNTKSLLSYCLFLACDNRIPARQRHKVRTELSDLHLGSQSLVRKQLASTTVNPRDLSSNHKRCQPTGISLSLRSSAVAAPEAETPLAPDPWISLFSSTFVQFCLFIRKRKSSGWFCFCFCSVFQPNDSTNY